MIDDFALFASDCMADGALAIACKYGAVGIEKPIALVMAIEIVFDEKIVKYYSISNCSAEVSS